MKKTIIKIIISIFILSLVIYKSNINVQFITQGIIYHKYIFLCFIFPLLLNPVIAGSRWKIFLNAQGVNEHFISLIKINYLSIFLGILLPSSTGYDAIRIFQIEKRHKDIKGVGGASVIIERLLGFLILSAIGVIGAFIAVLIGVTQYILLTAFIIFIGVIIIFLVIKNKNIYIKTVKIFSRIKKGKKITTYLTELYKSINKYPLKKVLLPVFPLIIIFQISAVLCGYLIFKSFDINISFFYHIAFLPLIQIISIIPISISGFGLREGGFVYFYSLLGVSHDVAFAVSLLYYAILTLTPVIIGMFIYIFDKNKYTEIKQELK